ncbi:MAG: rod shape-determining protein MreC [Cycloclasticus sp.]|nr:rod shape-determining protein MreC [Cycloclasticus sp.]
MMWVDSHTPVLKSVRSVLGYSLYPLHQIATTPSVLTEWFGDSAKSRHELERENAELSARNLILGQKIQRLISLETENIELRELLGAADRVSERVVISEIISVDPDPYSQQILINKGLTDNVFIGQPVLDTYGLMGQVIDVLPYSSRVLLIADSNHAIPVQVNRNGVRAIAVGSGRLSELNLVYVPNTADIKVGDLLVSSGLGGRYPKGYPVAEVSKVEYIPGQTFAAVTASPSAHLDRSRHMLLVFNKGAGNVPPKTLWEKQ